MKKIMKFNPYDFLGKLMFYWFLYPLGKISKIDKNIKPIFKLIHKLFINSHISTFLALFYPLIFISILSNVSSPNYIVMGIASLIPIVIGVQVLPTIILNLKQSSILKRIGATNTKASDMTFVVISYFVLVAIFSLVFNVGIGIAMFSKNMNLANIQWGELIFSFLIGILVGISLGVMISSVIKKQEVALVIGLLLTLPGAFLTSEFLPPTMINDWGPMRYISFIFPQKISTTLVHCAVNGGSIFDTEVVRSLDYNGLINLNALVDSNAIPTVQADAIKSAMSNVEVVDWTEKLMAWILLPVYLVTFSAVSIKFFKWGTRW